MTRVRVTRGGSCKLFQLESHYQMRGAGRRWAVTSRMLAIVFIIADLIKWLLFQTDTAPPPATAPGSSHLKLCILLQCPISLKITKWIKHYKTPSLRTEITCPGTPVQLFCLMFKRNFVLFLKYFLNFKADKVSSAGCNSKISPYTDTHLLRYFFCFTFY